MPTYYALCDMWQDVPPPAVQLRRIAQYLGLVPDAQPSQPRMRQTKPSAAPSTAEEVAMAAAMAGLPAMQGRPADPMLDLIPPAP